MSDEDWKCLEGAGWCVDWKKERWFGALATQATKEFDTVGDAIREFENLTDQDTSNDCWPFGAPHGFSWDGGHVDGEGCLSYIKT